MKKYWIARICMTFCLVFGMVFIPMNQLQVQAAEVIATVSGTVMKETTSEILHLSTKDGHMEIKMDSETDTSACKVLLPGKQISVSVSHGSDGYLHAVRITSGAQTTTVSTDSSTTANVTGTISDKSTDSIIYFKTPQGDMEIKLDPTTSVNCVLFAGKTYMITCARGADAYMHALSITDSTSAMTSGSALTPAPASDVNNGLSTTSVTGTVNNQTKENLLYLSTNGGIMQIVIDSNTDSRNGMVLTPDRKVTVSVYRGSDAYMHAATITGVKDGYVSATINTTDTSTVTGTVGSKSTENILYLTTPQGDMELKLDLIRNVSNCKVLVSGKKLTVTCARGSDAYMHAVDIIGS
ncbi:MAG: hypothetical protein ACI4E5_08935 [Suilimivivens sp.]